ncbi:hypothetical protein P7C71_g6389, partial [Lecanoromycetidae sp. Uapishka_2]
MTTNSLPEQCCTLPPTKTAYTPLGRTTTIIVRGKSFPLYTTGPQESKHILVGIYDICGLHANTLRGADYLAAKTGYSIIIPDFFAGDGWDPNNIPPKEGRAALNAWIQRVGAWEKVGPVLEAVVEQVRKSGAEAIGAYGYCFGAKKLSQGAHLHFFKAMALIHPSQFQAEDADDMDMPVALMPSGGEDKDAMDGFWGRMQKKAVGERCVRQDFLDCNHGFASARSDWEDSRLGSRVREVYDIMGKFFESNL